MRRLALLMCGLVAGPACVRADGAEAASSTQPFVEKQIEVMFGFSYYQGTDDIIGDRTGLFLMRRSERVETILSGESDYLESDGRVLRNVAEVDLVGLGDADGDGNGYVNGNVHATLAAHVRRSASAGGAVV